MEDKTQTETVAGIEASVLVKKMEMPSNFAQTCNLLSRYVKEKGSLRDLNIEIGGRVESVEDIVKPGSSLAAPSDSPGYIKGKSGKRPAAETIPRQPRPDSAAIVAAEDASDKTSTSKERAISEQIPAQLTIFYSGKVLVFEDYPADKARELISLAKKGSSQMSYGILANALGEKRNPSAGERLPPRPLSAGISSNTCTAKLNPSTAVTVSPPQSSTGKQPVAAPEHLSDASGSDLPIARRSSIHRFLEKRKDRAAARGPYNNPEHPAPSSFSSKESREIDLNL